MNVDAANREPAAARRAPPTRGGADPGRHPQRWRCGLPAGTLPRVSPAAGWLNPTVTGESNGRRSFWRDSEATRHEALAVESELEVARRGTGGAREAFR